MYNSIIATNIKSDNEGLFYVGKMGYYTDMELDYYRELEREYRPVVYNPLAIFSTMRKYVVQCKKEDLQLWRTYKEPYDINDWFGEWWWEYCEENIEKLQKEVAFLTQKGYKKNIKNQADLLENAKQVKINQIVGVEDNGRDTQFIPCPLHIEKYPSLCIYKKSNTWHCYGCQAGSDSVDMYMKLNNVSFQEAIKELNR